jgi:CRP-like cAMP-binding protein
MYKQTKKKISFFRGKKDVAFIVWICPLLKPLLLIEETSIYKEEERVKQIYFMEQGKAAYILPRYNSLPYCFIEEGEAFGIVDIVFRTLHSPDEAINPERLRRKFSVMATEKSVMLSLDFDDFQRMQIEYPEFYDELFDS